MSKRMMRVVQVLFSSSILMISAQSYAESATAPSEPPSHEVASPTDVTGVPSTDTAQINTLASGALDDGSLSVSPPPGTTDLPLEMEPLAQPDPYERFNRAIFHFNDQIDILILKPIATFYNKIMPKPLNQGFHNFFLNIGNLPTIANDILQFNFHQAANDIWRTIINTTIGIGGLFDVGSRIGLMPYYNDFGLTLAAWGAKDSYYLVVPFWGPSTIRDLIGWPVDYYAFSIYPWVHPAWQRYTLYGWNVVDRRAQLLQFQSVLEEAALDQYVFVRNAYLQRRVYQIEQNKHRSYVDIMNDGAADQPVTDMADSGDQSATAAQDAQSVNEDQINQIKSEGDGSESSGQKG